MKKKEGKIKNTKKKQTIYIETGMLYWKTLSNFSIFLLKVNRIVY